jgi:hypothetical protein
MQWALALALIVSIAAANPASADCVASADCSSTMLAAGECARSLNDGGTHLCKGRSYGAIAYGAQSGSIGWSRAFADPQAAENEALSDCANHGGDCRVVIDFWNACAAVAADGPHVAYGLGDDQRLADAGAMAACQEAGGTRCAVQGGSCSLP